MRKVAPPKPSTGPQHPLTITADDLGYDVELSSEMDVEIPREALYDVKDVDKKSSGPPRQILSIYPGE